MSWKSFSLAYDHLSEVACQLSLRVYSLNMCVCMCVRECVYMCAYACVHVCMYVGMCVHVHVCTCV